MKKVGQPYLDSSFRIPLEYRLNYRFITKYMCKKYPDAARFRWQTMGITVEEYNNGYSNRVKHYTQVRALNKMFRGLSIPHRIIKKDDMNPIDAWYWNDAGMRGKLDNYYSENIDLVGDKELKEKLETMFKQSRLGTDRVQVINLLSVWKNYFS